MSERVSPIRVARIPGGPVTYLIDPAPDALPPVRSADLAEAWGAARDAACASQWGVPLLLRFPGAGLDLALADDDACCWAASVDQLVGMHTPYGISLCLRLLALIDLLRLASWLGRFYRLDRAGAALDPALLRVAATVPLTNRASFDEGEFHRRLARDASPALAARPTVSGATV